MSLPSRVTKPEDEGNREVRMTSPIRIDTVPSLYKAPPCGVLDAAHPIGLADVDQEAFASAERTRSALLALMEDPQDSSAIETVWQENAEVIEGEMVFHVESPSNQANILRVLNAVAARSKYFCDEFDDPKEWIARCANLEARRFALEVKNTH
jgi:thiamine pyrophosphate-dependent acetolactate synthase large subunit-like protein